MPAPPNKLSRFWKDLKRRGVVQVITVYTSIALVLIEIINNLIKYFDLPPILGTFVIVILAVGFPLTLILSWLYDLSGDGIERTKSIDELKEQGPVKVTNAWKIATYVSFAIILSLVTFNILKGRSGLRSGDIKSLAILPFDNYTGDNGLDYVAAGMHSTLIGDMGKLGELRVIGKTTSNAYRNTDISAPDIARELNVEALVEPTVTCYGDSVCIQIRVITFFPEERQLWVGDFKEDKSQILNLYNRITRQIADEILVKLSPEEKRLFTESRTIDKEAYDEYLKGLSFLDDFSKEAMSNAMNNLNSAIEKEPDWAPLYAGLAKAWVVMAQIGYVAPSLAYQNVNENLDKALEHDPELSEAHFIRGMSAYLHEWNWDKGEKEFLKALAINPNDGLSRIYYSHLLAILQRPEEALAQGQLALDLDPLNPLLQCLYSALLVINDDCEKALDHLEKIVAINPENPLANNIIEMAAFRCQDYQRAFKVSKYLLAFFLEEEAYKKIEIIYEKKGFMEAYEEIALQLELYAETNPIPPTDLAVRNIYVNNLEKAMGWVEKGYEIRDPNMPYIATGINNMDPLFDDPRFIAILEKMNLPLPKTN